MHNSDAYYWVFKANDFVADFNLTQLTDYRITLSSSDSLQHIVLETTSYENVGLYPEKLINETLEQNKLTGEEHRDLWFTEHIVDLPDNHWDWLYRQPGGEALKEFRSNTECFFALDKSARNQCALLYRFISSFRQHIVDFKQVQNLLLKGDVNTVTAVLENESAAIAEKFRQVSHLHDRAC